MGFSPKPLLVTLGAVVTLTVCGSATAATGLRGVDVSNHNTTLAVDWLAVASSGTAFAIAKASEGTTYIDPTYSLNRSGTQLYGIRFGAYHFGRPAGSSDATITASAIAQANYFVDAAQPAAGDIPPVLDLEVTGSLSPVQLQLWTQAWLDEVEARTGLKAQIYTSPSFWRTRLGDTAAFASTGHRLWVAHWTKDEAPLVPAVSWGGANWTFWQWTNCTVVPGFAHCLDGDRFNGADLTPILVKAPPNGRPILTTAPTVVGATQVSKVLAAIPGGWGGGKPVAFTYQWESCDTAGANCLPIAGATGISYKLTGNESGHTVVVAVTAQNATSSLSALSSPTTTITGTGVVTPVEGAPAPATPPEIQGSAVVGQTLSSIDATWTTPPTTVAYQWQRCNSDGDACVAIPGAIGSDYAITPGDIGSTLSLVQTATGPGGSTPVPSTPTAVVAPAEAPAPTSNSGVVTEGVAGAVATLDHAATVTWQPGAVPVRATVAILRATTQLALPAASFHLRITPPRGELLWPIDVTFAAPRSGIASFSTDGRFWHAIPKLDGKTLAADQDNGWFKDGSSRIHVLTRFSGRFAFFAANRWGDPRQISDGPALQTVAGLKPLRGAAQSDGTLRIITQVPLASQAHVFAKLLGPKGQQPLIRQKASRLGVWLHGIPLKTVQALVLTPGALKIRLNVSLKALTPKTTYRLQLVAIDPYGRRSTVVLRVRFG